MASFFETALIWLMGFVGLGLAVGVYLAWRVEVRVWLIPKSTIQELAADLSKRYAGAARREAAKLELAAFTNNQIFEAGKWARVTAYLRAQERDAVKKSLKSSGR